MRFAACNALGQLSADFAPEFQRKYHSKVNMRGGVHVHDVCLCVCMRVLACVRACMHAWCVLACVRACMPA